MVGGSGIDPIRIPENMSQVAQTVWPCSPNELIHPSSPPSSSCTIGILRVWSVSDQTKNGCKSKILMGKKISKKHIQPVNKNRTRRVSRPRYLFGSPFLVNLLKNGYVNRKIFVTGNFFFARIVLKWSKTSRNAIKKIRFF